MDEVHHCEDCNYMGPLVLEVGGEMVEAIDLDLMIQNVFNYLSQRSNYGRRA